MTSVFTLLDEIRKRPSMYVGGDECDKIAQLRTLETLLSGYGLAVRLHDLDDPGLRFNKSFAAYLRQRFGWPTSLGPVIAIVDGTPPGEDAYEHFWTLIDDYQKYLSDQPPG